MFHALTLILLVANAALAADAPAPAKKAAGKKAEAAPKVELVFPPALPDGKQIVSIATPEFLKAPETLQPDVTVAKTAPTVDFMYYPGQDYLGNPWSNWGDSLAVNGKYYSAIGDHLAANGKDLSHGTGTAYLTEYDPEKKSLRIVCDVAKVLKLPAGHYTPGKIHSRIDLGSDGCLYFSTHRGSTARDDGSVSLRRAIGFFATIPRRRKPKSSCMVPSPSIASPTASSIPTG